MKGKIALIMVNDPPATPAEPQLFGGDALTYYGRWTYKYEEAARQGAVGAMLIHTDASATYPWQVVQSSWSGTQYSLPAGPGDGAGIQGVGHGSRRARHRAACRRGPRCAPEGGAHARREAGPLRDPGLRHHRAEGAAEDLAERRWRVEGQRSAGRGHLHLALRPHGDAGAARRRAADADRIYNGALDNASGLAGTLEVAQALARARTRPLRSIYILFTTAEESGLLGSEYLASRPALPAGAWRQTSTSTASISTAARATSCCSAPSARRWARWRTNSRPSGRASWDPIPNQAAGTFRSDHFPLAKMAFPRCRSASPSSTSGRIPATRRRCATVREGLSPPSDELRTDWDYTGAVEDMRLLAELGWRVATRPSMPAYRENEQFARPRATATR